jgi:hypothetical protein
LLERTDFPALAVWRDNYCHAHPLDKILLAAVEFYDALMSSKKP